MNDIDTKIEFTIEMEQNNKLPFQDVRIIKK